MFAVGTTFTDLCVVDVHRGAFTGEAFVTNPNAPPAVGVSHISPSYPEIKSAMTVWSSLVSDNIKRLKALPKGWDGPRSLPINHIQLDRARALISESLSSLGGAARAPFIAPLAGGGIQVEWHTLQGEIELELQASGAASVWVREHSTGYELDAEGAKAINLFLHWAPRLAQEPADANDVQGPQENKLFAVAA